MTTYFKLNESLSIMIPAYNEEDNLSDLIKQTFQAAKKITTDFEIVIVNDGSSDNTASIAEALAETYKNVRVVSYEKNQGLAHAFRTGIQACRKNIILYIEGDGQQPLKDQYGVLKKIKNADVVLGSRSYRFDYSLFRKTLSYGFLFLLWLFFGLKFKDVGWSQVYRRKIFDKVKLKSTSPFFCAELIVKALRNGFNVTEAPVFYRVRESGITKYGNVMTAYEIFKEMIMLRLGLLN
jgi:glycosyltransferase involved in cell wall biosynthesis